MRSLKWILRFAVLLLVGVILWIAVDAFRPINLRSDVRSAISRSATIACGHVVAAGGRSRIIIDEIWKSPSSGAVPSIGSSVASPLPAEAKPSSVILCFRAGRTSPSSIIAVYGDRIPAANMSVSDVKALCGTTPGT
jgi:hypothetical protein